MRTVQVVFALLVAFALLSNVAVEARKTAKAGPSSSLRVAKQAAAKSMQFRAAAAKANDEGSEEPAEEGEEPLTAQEVIERRIQMQTAIRERQHEAVEKAQDAAREFEECVDECRANKESALAEAAQLGSTPPPDPNRECCVNWHNYLCFCFAGGCCGSDE